MSMRSRAMEAASALGHHRAERIKTWRARREQMQAKAEREPWSGLHSMEERLLLSATMDAGGKSAIISGLTGLSQWATDLDGAGQFAELLPFIDQNAGQTAGQPQDVAALYTIGNLLNLGSEGGSDGIFTRLKTLATTSLGGTSDTGVFATALEALTLTDGDVIIDVVDQSNAANDLLFTLTLTVTRDTLHDLAFELGQEAEDLGLSLGGGGADVDLDVGLSATFTFGYDGAGTGFFLTLDEFTASATIDNNGAPFALGTPLSGSIGVLGVTITGATVEVDAHIDVFFADGLLADGKVRTAELAASIANDEVELLDNVAPVLAPASADGLLALTADASFELKVGGSTLTIVVAAASTADNTSIDDLVDDVQSAVSAALTAATLSPTLVAVSLDESAGFKLVFTSSNASNVFTFVADDSDPAVTELGLINEEITLTAANDAVANGQLTADAAFTLTVDGDAFAATIALADTDGTNGPANVDINDLADDLRAALLTAGVDGDVVSVEVAGGKLVFRSTREISIDITGTAETELGFTDGQSASLTAGDSITAAAAVVPALYGQPSGAIDFDLVVDGDTGNALDIVVSALDLDGNRGVDDFLADLNAALAAELVAEGFDADLIVAARQDGRYVFIVDKQSDAATLEMSALAGDPVITELGFVGGQTATRQVSTAVATLPISAQAGFAVGDEPDDETVTIGSETESLFGYTRTVIDENGNDKLILDGPPVMISQDLAGFGTLEAGDILVPLLKLGGFLDAVGDSTIFRQQFLPLVDSVQLSDLFGSGNTVNPFLGLGDVLRQQLRFVAPLTATNNLNTPQGRLTSDVTFSIAVAGLANPLVITVQREDTDGTQGLSDPTNQAPIDPNVGFADLVSDIEAALVAALQAQGADARLVEVAFTDVGGGNAKLQFLSDREIEITAADAATTSQLGLTLNQTNDTSELIQSASTPLFTTIQDLLTLLSPTPGLLTAYFDNATDELTFGLSIDGFEQAPIDVPFKFDFSLDPQLKALDIGANVTIDSQVGLQFTFGIDFTPTDEAAVVASADNRLPQNGRLSADATFNLRYADGVPIEVTVVVAKADTDNNTRLDDANGNDSLVEDVQAAVDDALGVPGLVVVGLDSSDGYRLTFTSAAGASLLITVEDPADTAITELGLVNQTVELVAANPQAGGFNGQLSNDAVFTLNVGGVDVSVTIPASATSSNSNLEALIRDINDALADALTTASLADDLVVASIDRTIVNNVVTSRQIKFTSDRALLFNFVSDPGNSADVLGFTNGQSASESPATADAGVTTLTALGSVQTAATGRVTGDELSFRVVIDGGDAIDVTVGDVIGEDLTTNTDLDDLVDDINAALGAALTGEGLASNLIVAAREGNQITLTLDALGGTSLRIFADAGDPLLTELGFTKGQVDVALENDGFFFDDDAVIEATVDLSLKDPTDSTGIFGFLGLDIDESKAALRGNLTISTGFNADRAVNGRIAVEDLLVQPAVLIGALGPDETFRVADEATFVVTIEGEAPVSVTVPSLTNSIVLAAAGSQLGSGTQGRLTGNAEFTLQVGDDSYNVTVVGHRDDVQVGSRQNGTNLNQTPAQLLLDIKAAIEDATGLIGDDLTALVDITLVDGRLQFASRKPVTITATDAGDVAANELGLGTTEYLVTGEVDLTGDQQPGDDVLTMSSAVSANVLTTNAIFILRVGAKNISVTVNAASTTGNGSAAALAADVESAVNTALMSAGLSADLVTVSVNGSNQLVFTSASPSTLLAIRSLNGPAQNVLGLARTPVMSTFDLSKDAEFTISIGGDVVTVVVPTVDANLPSPNDTVQDLLADVQAAVESAFTTALLDPSRITVELVTTNGDTTKGKLRFRSAELITISTPDTANTARTQLGLTNAFTATDLAAAINEGLADAGLGGRVGAGVAQATDGSGAQLIALGLDSPYQTLTADFTASPALAAALGFTSGAPIVSTQTKIGETDDAPPQDILLGEPVLSDPVYTSSIAGGYSADIDAILAGEATLQFVLTMPGVIADITDGNGDPIAFDITVKSTDLIDPDTFTLSRTSSTVAENLAAQDVVDVLIGASDVLLSIFASAAILKRDLPILSANSTEFNNFVAPVTSLIANLTSQSLPSTLQEINRLVQEALNITASGSLFAIDGDSLGLALNYENSQTFAAPFVIDLAVLNELANPAPLTDPRAIVAATNTVRHDITSTAAVALNLSLDFTGVDRAADSTDAPAGFVLNTGDDVVTINVHSLAEDLFLTALYGLERISITAGAAQLGDGSGGDAVIAIELITPDGTLTPIEDVLERSDIEGVAASSPIVLDGSDRPVLTSDATFFITVDGLGPIEVIVAASDLIATPDFGIADLIADINAALTDALEAEGLDGNLVRASFVQAQPDGTPGDIGDYTLQLIAQGLLEIDVPTPGSNAAATILGLSDGQSGLVEGSITGEASVQLELVARDVNGNNADIGTLDVFVPSLQDALDGIEGSAIFFGDVPPLDDLISVGIGEEDNRLEQLLRDPEQLITGIDGAIDDIQTVLELILDPLGSLPVIGDNIIDPLLDFFEDLRQARRNFRDQIIAAVGQDNDIVEKVREILFDVFGPDGLGILVDETLDGNVLLNDVTVTTELDEPTDSLSDEFVQWDMHLGQSIDFRFPFSLDLGLQNLPGASASIPNFGFNLGAGKTSGITGATPLGSVSDMEDGVLDSNATFTLKVGSTTLNITVLASATDGSDGNDANQSRQDLLMDVQAAIEAEMRDAGLNATQVTVDINDDGKLRIYSSKDLEVSGANAEARNRLGLDTSGGTLTSQEIDLGGGVVLTFSWDFYLGFGLSLGEGFYLNAGAVDAFGDEVKELAFAFEATVPQLTGRMALGLVQAEFSDGTNTRVRVTAPNSAIAKNGDEITKNFLQLDALFGREFDADFNLTTIKHDGTTESFDVDYESLGSVNFLQFLIDLNLELFSIGAGVLASADFSDVTHPTVIFVATSPDLETIEITGAEELGFDAFQVEDQRAIGLGFDNDQADATPNGEGQYELTALRSAPTEGRILVDTDMIIRVGGKDARIVLRSALNDDVEDIDDLVERIQKQLDRRLNQINQLPTDKMVVVEAVEIGGEMFLRIVSDKPVEIRGIDIQEHTGLLVELGVDLSDPSNDDGLNRLTLIDLFSAGSLEEVLAPSATVAAQIRLNVDSNTKHITGALENLFGVNEGGMGLPSLNFDLKIDLSLSLADEEEEGAEGEGGGEGGAGAPAPQGGSKVSRALGRVGLDIEKFVFDNVVLDVGDLLDNIIKPIAEGINTVFGPVIELVGDGADAAEGFLTDPLPVLDELGVELSMMDILDKVGAGQGIRTLFNAIRVLQGINETIETLGDTGQLNFGGWELVFDRESPLYFPRTKVPVPTELAESAGSIGLPSMFDTEFSATVEPGGFRLDILSVNSIINWILGEPFDIFSFNLPTIDINLGLNLPLGFSIGDFSLGINIGINAALHIDMGIGYDSTGIQQIIDAVQSGAEPDFADLLDGFFVRNQQGDELYISFDFTGGAALGPIEVLGFTLFDARASVYAGIYAGLDLIDPNEDGKLRISEVMELTNDFENPENLLALFDATLRVYGGFDFSITLFEITLSSDDLPFPTEFELEISLQDIFGYLGIEFEGPQPKFAEVIEQPVPGQGSLSGVENPVMEKVLRLNVGPFAYARIFGDTDDSDAGVAYTVISDGDDLLITAFGRTQRIDGDDLDDVTKIIGTGTDFGDSFNFSAMSHTLPIILNTGAGNDVFFGGAGEDTITGGLGDDSLHGGTGDDDLRGGIGNDALFGNAGSDLLEGGEGNDTLTGGNDSDFYSFDRRWGNDTIIETAAGGADDVIDFSLAEAALRRAALEPRARYRPIRDNLFVTMDIFGTEVTDLTNTVLVNPGDADGNGFNYPQGHRVERIITGKGDDLFRISASEANIPETSEGAGDGINFVTALDGFDGDDTYIFYGGDPRQIPSIGDKVFQTNLNGSNQLDKAVSFFVAIGDNAPFQVNLAVGGSGSLIDQINAALANGIATLPGSLSPTLITASLDLMTGLLTFAGGSKTFFAVYTSNEDTQPRVAPSSNDTQDQLGIPVIHGPMLGESLSPSDTGSEFDIDRQVTEGTNSNDVVGVTNQLISIRGETQAEADATVITYDQGGGGSGIEVLEVRLRAGNDVVNVESSPETASLLLQGYAGDDLFRFGVDYVNAERGPVDSILISAPITTDSGIGELVGDATFTVELGQRDAVTVTIPATDPGQPNRTLAQLGAAIEEAIADALGETGVVTVSVITDSNGDERLSFTTTESSINLFADESDPAAKELGLPRAHNLASMRGNSDNGPVLVQGGLGENTLSVFNTNGDGTANPGYLGETLIRGMGMDEGIEFEEVATLNILLSTGEDIFNVSAVTTTTNLYLRDGDDEANVGYIFDTNPATPDDQINLIEVEPRNLSGIDALLTVIGGNPSASDVLNVDASGVDDLPDGETTDTTITGFGMGGSIEYYSIEDLQFFFGNEDQLFLVESTNAGTVTTINAGDGNDLIIVGVDPLGGDGSTGRVVSGIMGQLIVHGDEGFDVLYIDDRADTTGDFGAAGGRVSATQIDGLDIGSFITYDTVDRLNIDLGQGDDFLTVFSTHGNESNVDEAALNKLTFITGGLGSDTFTVGNDGTNTGGANPLPGGDLFPGVDGIADILDIDGAGGFDTDDDSADVIIISDALDTSDNTGQLGEGTATDPDRPGRITDGQITGLDMPGSLDYLAFTTVRILLGTGDDEFVITNTDDSTESLNLLGGAGDDVFTIGDGTRITGRIDGKEGIDTVSYRQFTSGIDINLKTGRATGVFNGFEDGVRNVENAVGSAGDDFLTGSDGENLLIGNGGDDLIVGNGGDDTLIGGFANHLSGAAYQLVDRRNEGTPDEVPFDGVDIEGDRDGNDAIFGSAGDDLLIDGLGDDELFGGAGDDTYRLISEGFAGAGPGHNPPRPVSRDEVTDSGGNDTLDFSLALIGVDVSAGFSFGVTPGLLAPQGQSINDNNDSLVLSGQFETLIGSSFDDTLTGNAAANTMVGGGGDDVLSGAQGNDTLDGGEGDDDLRGGEGDDHVTGGEGNDALRGDSGNDALVGADGVDLLNGGAGTDTADYADSPAAINANLLTNQVQDGFGDVDLLNTVEIVKGTSAAAGNDAFVGNNSANIFISNGGDDTVNGTKGADVLRIVGTALADTITLESGANPNEIQVTIDNADGTLVQTILLTNVRTIDVSSLGGDDTIVVNALTATGLIDVIVNAGDGDDTIDANPLGGAIANKIVRAFGGAGDDTFFTGGADDTFDGGAGSDTVDFGRAAVAVDAKVRGKGRNDGHGRKDTYKNVENLSGSGFNDKLTGDSVANILLGRGGNDTITGGGAADVVDGGEGNDILTVSSRFAARVIGGEGNDTISGAKTNFADYSSSLGAVTFNFTTTTGLVADGLGGIDTIKKPPTIIGSDFADTLLGGKGTFTFIGAGGDDIISTGAAKLTIQWNPGDGSDTITGGASGTQTLVINGGDGDDVFTLTTDAGSGVLASTIDGDNASIRFTQMDNVTLSTSRGDDQVTVNAAGLITGLKKFTTNLGKGDDRFDTLAAAFSLIVSGNEGRDVISGGAGKSDKLDGGAGIDTVSYEHAPMAVIAGVRSTTNDGFGRRETPKNFENLIGSDFNDTLRGDTNANIIEGGAGGDLILGSGGNDRLRGGDGNDLLRGEAGVDRLEGGAGNDTFDGGAGAPADIADYSAADLLGGVTVDLAANTATDDGFGDADTFIKIAGVFGSSFADTLFGDDLANILDGRGGDDTLDARGGDDTILFSPGDGDDTVEAGLGSDTLRLVGTSGRDIFSVSAVLSRLVATSDDPDGSIDAGGVEVLDIASLGGRDLVTLGAMAASGVLEVVVDLGTGNDRLDAASADIALDVDGGAGADHIIAGLMPDTLAGGDGIDTLDLSLTPAAVIAKLHSGRVTHADATFDKIDTFENLIGTAFADELEGDGLANVIRGGGGNDIILGLEGDDSLYGDADNDTINGGLGRDHIEGGGGDDTLDGGADDLLTSINNGFANDTILGGDGNDTITGKSGNDLIHGGDDADTVAGDDGNDTITGGHSSELTAAELRTAIVGQLTQLDSAATDVAFPGAGATVEITGDPADDFTIVDLREAIEDLPGVNQGNAVVSVSRTSWTVTFNGGTGDAVTAADLREVVEAITGVRSADLYIEKAEANTATLTLIGESADAATAAELLDAVESIAGIAPGDATVAPASALFTVLFLEVTDPTVIGTGDIEAVLLDNLAGLDAVNLAVARPDSVAVFTLTGLQSGDVNIDDLRQAAESLENVEVGDVVAADGRATWLVSLGGDFTDLVELDDLRAAIEGITGVSADEITISRNNTALVVSLYGRSAHIATSEITAALEAVLPLEAGDVTITLSQFVFSMTFLHSPRGDQQGITGDNDNLDAGSGDDLVSGGAGDDNILGGSGNDQIDGGTGTDTAAGDLGDDLMKGWVGDDTLTGNSGSDRLFGGEGDDNLTGSEQPDELDNGPGNDEVHIANTGGPDTITPGAGTDSVINDDDLSVTIVTSGPPLIFQRRPR